jgi:hypothetical protein
MQMGDTTWIEFHPDESSCPGDPNGGHGGEATGGPDGSETLCLEGNGGAGDSCGSLAPWNSRCLSHRDMTIQPSDLGINYWHVDTYRVREETYTGTYALWCGSDTLWEGQPVECGTWQESAPGYGNNWNCIVQLTLPGIFAYTDGVILEFDVRYDIECNYDFLHAEYFDGETWENLASFTAVSDNGGGQCIETCPVEPSSDYFDNGDDDLFGALGWQTRSVPGSPAFHDTIHAEDLAGVTGFSWYQLEDGPYRFRHDAAYDSDRGRVVIFGGVSDLGMFPDYESDTYEWDDSTWVDMSPATNPGARAGHQMVYFPDSSHSVLFGGEDGTYLHDDTWVWDGTDWRELSPAHRPPDRYGHGMAYDSVRHVIVLFGGEGIGGDLGDTWEWNGVDWIQRFPATSPTDRVLLGGNGLAYDPIRHVTVLFGGLTAPEEVSREIWEWDGTNWTERFPATEPRRRYQHGIAYDPRLGGIVMHGGYRINDEEEQFLSDTWLWDGTDWSRLRPGESPAGKGSFAFIYDHSIGKLLHQGGTYDGTYSGHSTWKLDFGEPLRLRWRFVTDMYKSDADYFDTDGGAWIDNIRVDNGPDEFTEDFETGVADPQHWSFPDYEGLIDGWRMVHDPDPLYEGGDGGNVQGCGMDSSVVYKARPDTGFPAGATWRNGWSYSLMTPAIPIQNTGCVVQYDFHFNTISTSCDMWNSRVRFYDVTAGRWCTWTDPDPCAYCYNSLHWNIDKEQEVTALYGATQDSLQFAFDFRDVSRWWEFCRGQHRDSDLHIDNISVGFFDGHVTQFSTRPADLLHDTFLTGICGYNSFFMEYDPDTVTHYTGGTALPREKQFNLDVIERDGVSTVELVGSFNEGSGWVTKSMTLDELFDPDHPTWGGTYYGTFCPGDFSLAEWDSGTTVWYYVKVTDGLAQEEYFPAKADPGHPGHTGTVDNYLDFSVLPLYPSDYAYAKILLVDGAGDQVYDVSPCTGSATVKTVLSDLYNEVLTDAGYPPDRYDIQNAGGKVRIQPTDFSSYDAVVWFHGMAYDFYACPYDSVAQAALESYLAGGGKTIICGDIVAEELAEPGIGGWGCDSLAGDFFEGILGAEYLQEMVGPDERPSVEFEPVDSVDVFGVPTAVALDTLAIHRFCPEYRDMCWVKTRTTPPAGYTAQRLLMAVDPDVPDADGAVYVESNGAGQSVFFNFDLAGTGYCNGGTFASGWEVGRVELVRVILEDIFGLTPNLAGVGETPDLPEPRGFKWALHNIRRPCSNQGL